MGCRSWPTVAGRPSILVISSVGLIWDTGTAHGLNALPLMCDVQALHTSRPQPYFGPVTPNRSRSTHSRRTLSSASTVTCVPLSTKVWLDTGLLLERVGETVGGRLRGGRFQRIRRETQVAVVDRERRRHGAGGAGVG